MSLLQEGEQTGKVEDKFRNEQERLTNSARRHIDKACVAGIVTGLTMAVTPGGAVIALEVIHQLVASGVDLRKHELNKRKHNTSLDVKPASQ